MYARSAAFDTAMRKSHRRAFRADILYGGVVTRSGIPITGGSVAVDGTAAHRRRGQVTVVDADGTLTPKIATDDLSPYGHEIRIFSGIYLGTTAEMIPVATLRISDAASSGGLIVVDGFDRSRSVSRARFESPYVIAAGTNYATAIQALIESRLSGLTFNFVSTTATTPLLVLDQGADPWAEAKKMATAIGCELYFDPMGVCVLRDEVDPATTSPAWTYAEGEDSTLLKVNNKLSDEGGYNGVVCDGEATGFAPVHSVVYDTDPSSPTYSLGPYGKVPYFMRSTMITSQVQCDAAAAAQFLRLKGGTELLSLDVISHAAHDAGDVVLVQSETERVDGAYVLESFPVPLGAKSDVSMTTRKRRSA